MVLIMSFRTFFRRGFRQQLKKASGELVNKNAQLDLNNLAICFQFSLLFELSKRTKTECLLFCWSHKL